MNGISTLCWGKVTQLRSWKWEGCMQCLSECGNDLGISVSLLGTLFINVTWSEHCDRPFKLSLTGTKPQICSVSDSKLPKHPVSSQQSHYYLCYVSAHWFSFRASSHKTCSLFFPHWTVIPWILFKPFTLSTLYSWKSLDW